MSRRERIAVDTNVLISRLLVPGSVAGRAVDRAVDRGRLLVSEATMVELTTVLGRAKFDPCVSLANRQQFIRLLGRIAELVPILRPVRACRDPKDDMFLEVAVNGGADLIVTGDRDLLELHPFLGSRSSAPLTISGVAEACPVLFQVRGKVRRTEAVTAQRRAALRVPP